MRSIEPTRHVRMANLSESALIKAVGSKRLRPICGYVYFLGEAGNVKIGMTSNVRLRARQLSIKHSKHLPIIHTIKTDDMRCLEFRFHYHYKHKQTSREWFCLSEKEIEYIKKFNGPTDEMLICQPKIEPYEDVDVGELPF